MYFIYDLEYYIFHIYAAAVIKPDPEAGGDWGHG
jgi:hypothetical protein